MFQRSATTAALCGAIALTSAHQTTADVTAEAEVVLTITINDIFVQNPDNTGFSAYDFNASVSNVDSNSTFFGGPSPSNDPGSIGSSSQSEVVLFNGADISDGNFEPFAESIGPGDTITITQNVQATATSPDSLYFSQITSDISIGFDSFTDEDDQFFIFDISISAELTGEFDLTMP
ncbi:MAG: hypothetical protein AAF085_12650, partial [Planctomycetota bacterium]